MTDFNIQQFLSDMRAETNEGFNTIRLRSEIIAANLVAHERADILVQVLVESRLKEIEKVAASVKWFVRVGIVAIVTFLFDLLLYHVPLIRVVR